MSNDSYQLTALLQSTSPCINVCNKGVQVWRSYKHYYYHYYSDILFDMYLCVLQCIPSWFLTPKVLHWSLVCVPRLDRKNPEIGLLFYILAISKDIRMGTDL